MLGFSGGGPSRRRRRERESEIVRERGAGEDTRVDFSPLSLPPSPPSIEEEAEEEDRR